MKAQLEDGYTRIANTIMEHLARTRMGSQAFRVSIALIRKTYGFHKKRDSISLSQFSDMTGLPRSHVARTLKSLIDKRIVTKLVTPKSVTYGINTTCGEWQVLPKLTSATKLVTEGATKLVTEGATKLVTPPKPKNKKKPPHPDHGKAVKFWCDEFENRFAVKYTFKRGEDGTHVKALLTTHGLERLKSMMTWFLQSKDQWMEETNAYTLGVLRRRANQINIELAKHQRAMADRVKALTKETATMCEMTISEKWQSQLAKDCTMKAYRAGEENPTSNEIRQYIVDHWNDHDKPANLGGTPPASMVTKQETK